MPPIMIEGKPLSIRPFSPGHIPISKKIGLTLFGSEKADAKELPTEELFRQVATFLWMLTTPPRDLIRMANDGSYKEEVDVFALTLPLDVMPEILRRINDIAEVAASAAVDIVSKPESDAADKDAPGN